MRNPFRLLRSEHLSSDLMFLRMFGSSILEVLQPHSETLWKRVLLISSSPGGGKTSIMRLFTPSVLNALYNQRAMRGNEELFKILKNDMEVFGNSGPELLAVMFSVAGAFQEINKLGLDDSASMGVFGTLVDVSIGLAILQNALSLLGYSYPTDLGKLEVYLKRNYYGVQGKTSAITINDTLSEIEREYLQTIDSFEFPQKLKYRSLDFLPSLDLLRLGTITHNGTPIFKQAVLMFDDFQLLSKNQMRYLLENLIDTNRGVGVWVAMRTEALAPMELLSNGARESRDFTILNLEHHWRKNRKTFRESLRTISDKRVQASRYSEIGGFEACIQSQIQEEFDNQRIRKIRNLAKAKTIELLGNKKHAEELMNNIGGKSNNLLDEAILWRSLQILIERGLQTGQMTLLGTPQVDVPETIGSDIKAAAEQFISQEHGIPIYYGMRKLAIISTSNYEQYLAVAGDIFEESIAKFLLKKPPSVSPSRQQAIIHQRAQQRWDAISYTVRHGESAKRLLEAIGEYAKRTTYLKTAPYAPGVTGIGIERSDFQKLMASIPSRGINGIGLGISISESVLESSTGTPSLETLATMILSCITNNLLEKREISQGGRKWFVLDLNRLLCTKFSLSLSYGGWKPIRIPQLRKWAERGFLEEDLRGVSTNA